MDVKKIIGIDDARRIARMKGPRTQVSVATPHKGVFHGNQHTRRQVLRLVLTAPSFRAAAKKYPGSETGLFQEVKELLLGEEPEKAA